MNNLIENLIIQPLIIIGVCIILLTSIGVPIGIMFGIAFLVDTYSAWFLLLFIPFIGFMDLAMREF